MNNLFFFLSDQIFLSLLYIDKLQAQKRRQTQTFASKMNLFFCFFQSSHNTSQRKRIKKSYTHAQYKTLFTNTVNIDRYIYVYSRMTTTLKYLTPKQERKQTHCIDAYIGQRKNKNMLTIFFFLLCVCVYAWINRLFHLS